MKKFVCAISLLAFSGVSAMAADIAPRPYTKAPAIVAPVLYNWTGGYIGVQGGYGWGHSDQTDPGLPPPQRIIQNPVGDGHFSASGGLIGGTGGYNWQSARFVYGLEGDYSWADVQGQSNLCGPAFALHSCGTKLRSLGTLRGRVGYAAGDTGNWLLYATGGLAVGDVYAWDNLLPASGSATRAGWTVGAGVETAFAPNWTVKLEYLYVDLGKATLFNIIPTVPETVSFTANIVRAGVNYKFGGPVVAKY
jgi:outer membrane immunogenic protein